LAELRYTSSVLLELALAIAGSAGGRADLGAAAAASGRPPECWPERRSEVGAEATVWTLARQPRLERYCALLAQSHARLGGDPARARTSALEAARLEPERAAPHVALGRIAARLGQLDVALRELDAAEAIDLRSVEQPIALHDFGAALRQAGKLERALRVYRLLVPRSVLGPSRSWRARVLLEAAHLSMATRALTTNARANAEPPELDDALAYLREATEDPHHELRVDTALSLVLVLDRAGRAAQADAVLADLGDSSGWAAPAAPSYLARPADRLALEALATERTDPRAAALLWKRFLDEGRDSPTAWTLAARARLERLERGAAPRRRKGGR
jgi:Flp pilus assembly protein TadD